MKFGLIGKSLSHSYSKKYFEKKFAHQQILQHQYENFELTSLEEFPGLIAKEKELRGLNVTVPYKEGIIPYLDDLTPEAEMIGAVNVISINGSKLKGHNTDWEGFSESIDPLLEVYHQRSLILGSGGASKAVAFGLGKLGMTSLIVSRNPQGNNQVDYQQASQLLEDHFLLINTTPVGTHPNREDMPPVSLEYVGEKHFIYDLIYNPTETKLLREASLRGAQTANGLKMLELQAEKAWDIWNEL